MTTTTSYSGCNGSPSAQAQFQLSFPPLFLVSSFSYFQTADTQIIEFFTRSITLVSPISHNFPNLIKLNQTQLLHALLHTDPRKTVFIPYGSCVVYLFVLLH